MNLIGEIKTDLQQAFDKIIRITVDMNPKAVINWDVTETKKEPAK